MTPLIIGLILVSVYALVLYLVYTNEKRFKKELKEEGKTLEDFFNPKNVEKNNISIGSRGVNKTSPVRGQRSFDTTPHYVVIPDTTPSDNSVLWTGHDFNSSTNDSYSGFGHGGDFGGGGASGSWSDSGSSDSSSSDSSSSSDGGSSD